MTTNTIDPATNGHATPGTGTAAGSPPSGEGVREETPVEGQPEGESPAGGTEGGEPEAQTSPEEAEREVHVGRLEALRDLIDSDPDLKAAVLRKIRGEPDEPEEDVVQRTMKSINDTFDPAVAKGLTDALTPFFEEYKALREGFGQLRPQVQEVRGVVSSTQFERNLLAGGIAPETLKSPAFKAHLASHRAKGSFKALESRDPSYAAEIISSTWAGKTNVRAERQAEKGRIDAARGGVLQRQAPRGATQVGETVKLRRNDPNLMSNLHALFAKGVKREQIQFD